MKHIPMPSIKRAERCPLQEAGELLEQIGYRGYIILTTGEAMCVLDSHANGEDIIDALEEYRMWRTPAARAHESMT